MDRKALAGQVRRARVGAGLTQAELAARAGTTQSAVSRLESGRLLPTLAVLRRVAVATGRPITIVLGATDPGPPAPLPAGTAAVRPPPGRPLPSASRRRVG